MAVEEKTDRKRKLDLTDEGDVALLGQEAQKNIAELTDSLFSKVKKENMDAAIKLLKEMAGYMSEIMDSDAAPKGILFGHVKRYDVDMKEIYKEAAAKSDELSLELKRLRKRLSGHKEVLAGLETKNLEYYNELELSYNEGKAMVESMDSWMNKIEKSWPKVEKEDTEDYLCVRGQRKNLAKRVEEICVSLEISARMTEEFRLLQKKDREGTDKIKSVLDSLTEWKSQVKPLLEKGKGFAKAEKVLSELNSTLNEGIMELISFE